MSGLLSAHTEHSKLAAIMFYASLSIAPSTMLGAPERLHRRFRPLQEMSAEKECHF